MLLLHISDIHFRKTEIGTPMDPNLHLRSMLLADATAMCKKLGAAPSAILISGDIAFAADQVEYDFALHWLEKLAHDCGAKVENIFVIPGNHDVDRKAASRPLVRAIHQEIKAAPAVSLHDVLRAHLQDAESIRVMYTPLDAFNLFAGQFFCDVSAPSRTIATRDLKLNDGSTLRLSGLNSALVSSDADKRGDLFVDPACFQITNEPGVVHLTLCHHPYFWLSHGQDLKGHLNDVAKIQLFGHEHSSRIELLRDCVCIAASAAHPERTEHGWEPGYNLIELNVDVSDSHRSLGITAHVRIWQSNPGQFRPKMDRDKEFFRHVIELDAWVAPVPKSVAPSQPVLGSQSTVAASAQGASAIGSDPMDTVRSLSVRFFKLTLSQKSQIAGKLGLIEDVDLNQPDFERFRRVFERAKSRNLIDALDAEVRAAQQSKSSSHIKG